MIEASKDPQDRTKNSGDLLPEREESFRPPRTDEADQSIKGEGYVESEFPREVEQDSEVEVELPQRTADGVETVSDEIQNSGGMLSEP